MKKNALRIPLMMATLFVIFVAGCKKEHSDSLSPDQEQQAAGFYTQSETESELVFNDVFDNVLGVNSEVGIGGTGVFGRKAKSNGRELNMDSVPACLTVSKIRLNPAEAFPLKIILDFGSGCPGNDGHVRSGRIVTIYTGRLIIPGKSATSTFEDFKLDSIAVRGTHTITNTGSSAQMQFTVDVTDARLSKPGGNYAEWSSHRTITQVEGNLTPLPVDDVFSIRGSAHGRVKHGSDMYAWQSEITEPLRKKFTCRWISQGILKIKRETLPDSSPWVATLNYGNGTCDYLATLTVNGQNYQFILPH